MVGIKKDIFRIVDANFNRSREGLRVCEDISRFALNSPAITADLKSVRHGVSSLIKKSGISRAVLSEARDSDKDIGRCSKTPSEMKRSDLYDIFAANIERVKESLRVLEEVSKLIDRRISAKFSELRFRTYEIEKRAVKRIGSVRYIR